MNSWGLSAIPIGLGGFWVTSGIGTVVLTLLGALGLSTQVITPRTRSLDEAEVDALLTSLLRDRKSVV